MEEFSEKKIKCQFCPETLLTNYAYYKHANKKHKSDVSHEWQVCDNCKLFFPTTNALAHHRRAAHSIFLDSPEVECSFCPKKFVAAKSFYTHANSEHVQLISDEWIGCKECSCFFPTAKVVAHHKSSAHRKLKVGAETYHCEYCPDSFSRSYTYYGHANKKHSNEISETWQPCTKCSLMFPTVAILKLHCKNAHTAKKDDSEKTLCVFCPKALCDMNHYYRHANLEHQEEVNREWLMCPDCQTFLPNATVLLNHKYKAHPSGNRDVYPCAFCSKILTNSSRYYTHANHEHVNEISSNWCQCEECNDYFPSETIRNSHFYTSHGKKRAKKGQRVPATRMKCQFCPFTTHNKWTFYKHVNKKHLDDVSDSWVPCAKCQALFPSKTVAIAHSLSSVQCSMKEKSGTTNKSRRKSSKPKRIKPKVTKDEEDPLSSNNTKVFQMETSFDGLAPGVVVIVKEELEEVEYFDQEDLDERKDLEEVEGIEQEDPEYKEETTSVLMELDDMDRNAETEANNYKDNENEDQIFCQNFDEDGSKISHLYDVTNDFDCNECGRTFSTPGNLKDHVEKVHSKLKQKEAKCRDCDKSFARSCHLQRHIKTVHLDIKHFGCEECKTTFRILREVISHCKQTKHKRLKCEQCCQTFSEIETLKTHVATLHCEVAGSKDKRPPKVECEECGKKFKWPSKLLRHMQVHVETERYPCDACPKTFVYKDDLKRHLMNIHLKMTNRQCEFCGKEFQEERGLKRHRRLIHKQTI